MLIIDESLDFPSQSSYGHSMIGLQDPGIHGMELASISPEIRAVGARLREKSS
jgi:hypothetical protein